MSVARDVRNYLKDKPFLLEALEKNIANLSKLARRIGKDLGIKNLDAIKAGLRRYAEDVRKSKQRREERVLNLLKQSKITILDNVCTAIMNRDVGIENRAKMKVDSYFIYLLDKFAFKDLQKYKQCIEKTCENCTAIIVTSPKELEVTPGVIAFLTSLLAGQNINVIEFISCYTETIIVVDRADAMKSYEIISEVIG